LKGVDKMAKEENVKGQNKFLVTILVVVLLLVFLGLGYAMGGTKVVEKVVEKKSVSDKGCNDGSALTKVEADSLVNNLWKRVNFNAMLDINNYAELNYNGMKVSEMSDSLKNEIASKYIQATADNEMYKVTVKEENVRYAYDSIFGAGTYKEGQPIADWCGGKSDLFVYDSTFKTYTAPTPGCGGTSLVSISEFITKVEKSSSQLIITSVMGLYHYDKKVLYNDYESAINDKNPVDVSNVENVSEFMKKNKDSLSQYKYTFDIDSNGFYKYVGYEKIN